MKKLCYLGIFSISLSGCLSPSVSNQSSGNFGGNINSSSPITAPAAEWANTPTSAPQSSSYDSVAVDTAGNVIVGGSLTTPNSFSFGNGVTAAGADSINLNAVVVKYNSSGVAQWAKSLSPAPSSNVVYSVAVDGSGNVYAVGCMMGSGTYGFGDGISIAGPDSGTNDCNGFLVKYDSTGVTEWAVTTTSGAGAVNFLNVVVDASGLVDIAGTLSGNLTYGFGNRVTATSTSNAVGSMLLVQYSSSGAAQWASTIAAGNVGSSLRTLATDPSGNIYAVGGMGYGTLNFGNSVVVASANNAEDALLIKYNSSGLAQWAQTVTTVGNVYTDFRGVGLDSAGNIYVSGSARYQGTVDFGNSVSFFSPSNGAGGSEGVFLKYNNSGAAQWVQSLKGINPDASEFSGLSVDSAGNSYVLASLAPNTNAVATYDFGNEVTVTGLINSSGTTITALVMYNSNGEAQWTETVSGAQAPVFNSTALDSNGTLYGTAQNFTNGSVDFGNGIDLNTASSYGNALVVKY